VNRSDMFGEGLAERLRQGFSKRMETEGATFDAIRFYKMGGKSVGHGATSMFPNYGYSIHGKPYSLRTATLRGRRRCSRDGEAANQTDSEEVTLYAS
jgi:hypothetical protein